MSKEERERDESEIKALFPEYADNKEFIDEMVRVLRYI